MTLGPTRNLAVLVTQPAFQATPLPPPSTSPIHYIVLIALALRLALFMVGPFANLERAMEPDSQRYLTLADNLVEHRQFALATEDGLVHVPLDAMRRARGELPIPDSSGLTAETFRTPGYPLLLAVVKALRLPLETVLLIQCLLSSASVGLLYLFVKALLGSPRTASWAAALLAIHPADIVAANTFLSETLFTTLLLLGLWLVVRQRPAVIGSFAGGLAIGASVLVRPIAVALGPALALWMLVSQRRLRGAAAAFILAVASLLPTALWAARNHSVGQGWMLSTLLPINAYYYTAAHIRLAAAAKDRYQDWPAEVLTLHQELQTNLHRGEPVLDGARRMARETIAEHGVIYAQLLGDSALKFFTDHSVSDLYQRLGWTYRPTGLRDRLLSGDWKALSSTDTARIVPPALWMAANMLIGALAAIGLVRLAIGGHWSTLLLLLGVVAYFVLATQTNGLERFRLPVLGVLTAMAAVGVVGTRVTATEVAAVVPPPLPDGSNYR